MLPGNISDDEMLPPVGSSSQRKSIKTANQSNTNEIIKAYQVTAFKYVDSKYENRGKIGLAILGSKAAGNFSILLYGKGNAALAQVSINKDFEVTSGRDLYISFYDMKSENWSILFEAMDIYQDFFNRILILKQVSSKQDLIFMDVKIGESILVHDSDLCEAEIMISGVKNCEIVSTLYSSESQEANRIIRLKIGANKLLPAIDKGISGMMKGGQRIIVVSSQSTLLKGGSIKVPNDICVLISVKIVRIKTKTEKPAMGNECGDSEISLPNLNFNKDSDYDAGDQSKKTELLKRMERLGQPIVKFNVSEESDRSLSKSPDTPIYVQSKPAFVPRPQPLSNVSLYDSSPYNNQMIALHTANPMMATMQQMYQPLPPTMQTVTPDSNLVFTETRQHNTEMRIAISKLQDKIDRIADKLDSTSVSLKQPVGRHMDAENVFENIKRIIDENEVLKRECSQKSDTIDMQNKRINELLNKSQQYLEDSRNVLERSSATFSSTDSESQRKILKLEEEKLDLIRNLSKKTSELSNLEMRTDSLTNESQNYRNKSLEFTDQLDKLSMELGDLKLKNRSLLIEVDKLKEERSSANAANEDLIDSKRSALDNEKKLQNIIETLRNNAKEANGNIELVRKECENEIMEIRQRCNGEIEQLREKLKQERRMVYSKSNNLESEIDSVNKEWETKFNESKQFEATKLTKMNERNSELMTENSRLSREIFDLKEQLSLADNSTTQKSEEFNRNNRQLQRQLEDAQNRADETDRLRLDNDNYALEVGRLTKMVTEIGHLKEELQSTVDRKRQLESMVKSLTEELSIKPVTESKMDSEKTDVEGQIKMIMNDIFKKIKSEFELMKTYSGKEVNGKCMAIIRDSTVSLMKSKNEQENSAEESSESDSSDNESIDEDLSKKAADSVPDSPIISVTNVGDYLKPLDNETQDLASVVKNNEEIVSDSENNNETVIDNDCIEISDSDKVLESVEPKEITSEEPFTESEKNSEHEEPIEIVNDSEILVKEELSLENDDFLQNNNANMNVESDFKEDFNIDNCETNTEEIPEVENKMDLSPSLINDPIPMESSQSTDNVSNKSETIWETETKSSSVITADCDNVTTIESKEKNSLFSSDEDDDVSGFFEHLNQKKNSKVEKLKPVSSELDDELSWLHS